MTENAGVHAVKSRNEKFARSFRRSFSRSLHIIGRARRQRVITIRGKERNKEMPKNRSLHGSRARS